MDATAKPPTADFQPGDRVRDAKWDGQYTGTVNRVDDDGDVYVTWHGYEWLDDQCTPTEVTREPDTARDADTDEA